MFVEKYYFENKPFVLQRRGTRITCTYREIFFLLTINKNV